MATATLGAVGCGLKKAGTSTGAAGSGAGGSGPAAGGSGGGAAGAGGSGPIIHLDGGNDSDSHPISTPDANCGSRNKTAVKIGPDILILLDRSASMNDDVNNRTCSDGGLGTPSAGCGPSSKWAQIIPAITQVVGDTDTDVNWGLKFFPDSALDSCTLASTAAVDVGPGHGAAIAAAIAGATSANGGVVGYSTTPTRAGVAGAATYLSALTDKLHKFILLATDGQPTCSPAGIGGDDSTAAIGAVDAARAAGLATFVVGISTGASSADSTLSLMAKMGGLPRTGATPSYYPVTSAADLAAAIRTLIQFAATCTFQIGPAPTTDGTTSLDNIDVFGDGAPISRDPTHADGYDYIDASMQSIQVYGPACDRIMSGAIRDVIVTFRCVVT
ncbi:MAG TPA: hypothetical protein VIF57_28080 [Polyangia bacterium]